MAIQIDFNFNTELETPQVSPYNFYFVIEGQHNILKGSSNNFAAIWADPDAKLSGSRFYVGSQDTFMVVDLSSNEVIDWYTESHAGRGGEVLEGDDIVDINVGG